MQSHVTGTAARASAATARSRRTSTATRAPGSPTRPRSRRRWSRRSGRPSSRTAPTSSTYSGSGHERPRREVAQIDGAVQPVQGRLGRQLPRGHEPEDADDALDEHPRPALPRPSRSSATCRTTSSRPIGRDGETDDPLDFDGLLGVLVRRRGAVPRGPGDAGWAAPSPTARTSSTRAGCGARRCGRSSSRTASRGGEDMYIQNHWFSPVGETAVSPATRSSTATRSAWFADEAAFPAAVSPEGAEMVADGRTSSRRHHGRRGRRRARDGPVRRPEGPPVL